MNILIVEDDIDINNLLCRIVSKIGYNPQPAYSGTEAALQLERKSWDLFLLDLMLPGLSGEELLAMIRKKSDAGIIIISAKDERMTKVDMLRSGADDYITKPFDNEEVAARIEAQIRRLKKYRTPQVLTFKDIILNEETKQVTVNNIPVSLTAREYKLLRLFLTYPKKLFTKENIFAAIWESEYFDSANVVNVHMSNLRTKLAKANPDEEYIETIWGMGYRLKT